MERVSAILDANIEETKSQQGDVGVAMIDVIDDRDSPLPRRIALFRIDEVGDLEIERQIGLEVLGTACLLDVSLEL